MARTGIRLASTLYQMVPTRKNPRLLSLAPLILITLALSPLTGLGKSQVGEPTNKLLYMYRFFYLPFSIDFREGVDRDDILPFKEEKNGKASLLSGESFSALDSQLAALRTQWQEKSLFNKTPTLLNQTQKISPSLVQHSILFNKGPLDALSLEDRIRINELLKNKDPKTVAAYNQLRFIKSFLENSEDNKFHFFIFSPNWCRSSQEYRLILETYTKEFTPKGLVLHSIIVQDPNEQFFNSPVFQALVPDPKTVSHESSPRFMAFEFKNGQPQIYEEGDALKQLYERFFAQHLGFLENPAKRSVAGQP